jgi:cytochrome P450 family 628
VLLHTTAYRRGEWDLFVPRLSCLYVFLSLSLVGWTQWNHTQSKDSLSGAIKVVAWLDTCHVLGITLSMVVYRLWFHRLRQFPGPFWARISNVYLTVLTAKNLHLYSEVESLHQKYGDIVRVGE